MEEFHVEALAPPQAELNRPRREGVTLNRTVGECPLSHHESSRPAVRVRVPGALLEYREVHESRPQHTSGQRNQCQGRPRLTQIVMVTFKIRREALPAPRSMADPITITRVPQTTTLKTTQPPSPDLTEHHDWTTWIWRVFFRLPVQKKVRMPSHVANLLEDVKYFHNAALRISRYLQNSCSNSKKSCSLNSQSRLQLVQEASEALRGCRSWSLPR